MFVKTAINFSPDRLLRIRITVRRAVDSAMKLVLDPPATTDCFSMFKFAV